MRKFYTEELGNRPNVAQQERCRQDGRWVRAACFIPFMIYGGPRFTSLAGLVLLTFLLSEDAGQEQLRLSQSLAKD